jgi:hypothetical protein
MPQQKNEPKMFCPYCWPNGPNLSLNPSGAVMLALFLEGTIDVNFVCGRCRKELSYRVTVLPDRTVYEFLSGANT